MAFNLRQLEVFRLTMQTRNLTETARLLRVSQPAVSQTLKELEAQLRLSLFVRTGTRISPTGEARILLPEVERLLTQSGVVDSRAAELRDAGAGNLAIAATPNVAGCIIPEALAAFAQERPRVQVRLNAYIIQEVVRQVRQEGADLGFVYAPVDDPAIATEPILRARMVCILPTDHELAAFAEVSPAQLVGQKVILVDPATTPGLLLREMLDRLAVRLENVIETNLSYAAVNLVRHRAGIFISDPVILLSGLADGLVVRPLTPGLEITLTAIYSRQRPVPRLAVRFMTHVRLVTDRLKRSLETAV